MRNSSVLKQRNERNLYVSDQEFIDSRLQEMPKIAHKGPLIRSGKFSVQNGAELSQSFIGYPIEQDHSSFINNRYHSNPNGSIKSSGNPALINNKIHISSSKVDPQKDAMRISFSADQNDQSFSQGSNGLGSTKARDKLHIANQQLPTFTPQFSQNKKLPHNEERKRRLDALEKYVDTNFGGNHPEHIVVNTDSKESSERERAEEFHRTPVKKPSEEIHIKSQNIPSSEKPQNFRKNLYMKSNTGVDKSSNGVQNSTDSPSHFTPQKFSSQTQSKLLNSFEKELDNLSAEHIDVEEMHYFFVNFHQKSRMLMAKMK